MRSNLLTRINSARSTLAIGVCAQKFTARVERAKYKFKELNRRHPVFKNVT